MKINATINPDKLKNHPNNVRKTYSGISELAESIKAFGILQNLTVVPEPGHEESLDSFYVVCGNRRLMAAKEAGLTSIPCVITDMSEKEQISTMMTENMARSNLTPYEEGQGIQMMLDLGETEKQVAQKTGLSRTTIKRRLELAKLDEKIVAEKMSEDQHEGFFQLSLTDLYKLEQVKDQKERNRILKQAQGPENLKYLIDQHLEGVKKEENAKRIKEALKKAGIPRATKQQAAERYYTKYASLQYYSLATTGERIRIPNHSENAFYVIDAWSITVYDLVKKKNKGELTEEEQRQAEKTKKEKAFKKIEKALKDKRKEFIRDILVGKYKLLGKEKDLWFELIETTNTWVSAFGIAEYLFRNDGDQHITNTWARAMMKETPIEIQLMAIIGKDLETCSPFDAYDLSYKEENADKIKRFHKALAEYGFSVTDETERAFLDGTHEFYKKKD